MKQNLPEQNTENLVCKLINHDETAKTAFYGILNEFAKRSCLKLLGEGRSIPTPLKDFQQEVTSETYFALAKNNFALLHRFMEPQNNLEAYLTVVVRRKATEYLDTYFPRKATFTSIEDISMANVAAEGDDDDEIIPRGMYDEHFQLFQEDMRKVSREMLLMAINQLPSKQKAVMYACFENILNDNELSEMELAQTLDMTPGNFARNKSVAMRTFSRKLEPFKHDCAFYAA